MPAPLTINLVIYQGATWSRFFEVKDDNGNARDLTGFTIYGKLRKSHASTKIIASFTSVVASPAVAGSIQMFLTAAETLVIDEGRYVYDIEINNGAGEVYRVVQGMVTVNAGSSRTITGQP